MVKQYESWAERRRHLDMTLDESFSVTPSPTVYTCVLWRSTMRYFPNFPPLTQWDRKYYFYGKTRTLCWKLKNQRHFDVSSNLSWHEHLLKFSLFLSDVSIEVFLKIITLVQHFFPFTSRKSILIGGQLEDMINSAFYFYFFRAYLLHVLLRHRDIMTFLYFYHVRRFCTWTSQRAIDMSKQCLLTLVALYCMAFLSAKCSGIFGTKYY